MYDLQKPRGKYRWAWRIWMKVGKTWNESVRHPGYLTLTAALSLPYYPTPTSPRHFLSWISLFLQNRFPIWNTNEHLLQPNLNTLTGRNQVIIILIWWKLCIFNSFTTERVWSIKVFIKYRTRLFKCLKGNYIYMMEKRKYLRIKRTLTLFYFLARTDSASPQFQLTWEAEGGLQV